MSKGLHASIIILILVFSALLTTVFFQPQDIFSDSPIYTDDYAMHFSQCISINRFLRTEGSLWGYDPFLLAGFPRGTLHPDIMAWALFYTVLSPVVGAGTAFKLFILIFLMIYPLGMYGAMRNFGFSQQTGLTAALLAILVFHLSLPIDFMLWGVASYVITCFFSIYVLSLIYRLCERFTWKIYVGTVFSASLLWLMHVLAPVHFFIPALVIYICSLKKLSRFQNLMLLVIPLVVLGINSCWLIPLAEFFNYKTTRPENYEFTLQIKNIFEAFKVYIEQKRSLPANAEVLNNTFIEVIIALFGMCGFYLWSRKGMSTLLKAFSSGVLFIFFIAYFGSHTQLFAQLQPQRFTIPLNLLLIIPAGYGCRTVLQEIFQRKSVVAIFFILCLGFVLLYRPVVKPFGIFYKYKTYRFSCAFPQQLIELLDFLEKHTTRQGRILIEDSESSAEDVEQYYGGHFPGLFPEYLKREYLCGPRPMYPIKHSYASFTKGLLFEKDISGYSHSELRKVFDIYNVKWIVCWFDASKDFLEQFPGYITRVGEVDKFAIYEIDRQSSFFLKGSGDISADYNRLEADNVVAEKGEIILAYHWMKNLRSIPDLHIRRVFVGDDQVGFIKIENPPKDFVLINGY